MEVNRAGFTGPSRLNSLEGRPLPFQLGEAIGIAAARSGLSHKQLCAHMELDPGTWSKQLQGDGHISFGRLMKCPHEFWLELLPLVAHHYGMSVAHSNGISQSIARCLVSMADVIGRLELSTSADRKVSGL
jgi:hypothetical protein